MKIVIMMTRRRVAENENKKPGLRIFNKTFLKVDVGRRASYLRIHHNLLEDAGA